MGSQKLHLAPSARLSRGEKAGDLNIVPRFNGGLALQGHLEADIPERRDQLAVANVASVPLVVPDCTGVLTSEHASSGRPFLDVTALDSSGSLPRNGRNNSMGNGKMIVEFLSEATSVRVWR